MSKSNEGISRRDLIKGTAAISSLAVLGTSAVAKAEDSANAAAVATARPKPFAELSERMRGKVIGPNHARYDAARKIFNDMIDRRPLAIAKCKGAADVMQVIRYARERDLPISVRGGGHNVAGKSVRDGALLIDVGLINNVRADPARMRARAGAGALLGDLDHDTLPHGIIVPTGTVSKTGIAGLTLGGGFGWLQRKHGLTIDNFVSADIVTADGTFIVANDEEHPDLMWALRGGGGNFGVVTSFEYQTHKVEPTIGGMVIFPGEKLRDLLHFYREFTSTAPDSVMTMAGALPGIPGTPSEGGTAAWLAVCYSGDLTAGEKILQPLHDFGTPMVGGIAQMPFSAIQTMFDSGSPPGMRHYWTSSLMDELSDKLIDTLVDKAPELPLPSSMLLLEHLGGAIGRVGPTDTAFSGRNAQYNASILSVWAESAADSANMAWTRQTRDELKKFGSGGAYVNYMADDGGAAAVRAAYDVNLERLISVKRKYDPDNVFNANHNIVP